MTMMSKHNAYDDDNVTTENELVFGFPLKENLGGGVTATTPQLRRVYILFHHVNIAPSASPLNF